MTMKDDIDGNRLSDLWHLMMIDDDDSVDGDDDDDDDDDKWLMIHGLWSRSNRLWLCRTR